MDQFYGLGLELGSGLGFGCGLGIDYASYIRLMLWARVGVTFRVSVRV